MQSTWRPGSADVMGEEDPSLASMASGTSWSQAVSEGAEQALGQLREEASTQLKELSCAHAVASVVLALALSLPLAHARLRALG